MSPVVPYAVLAAFTGAVLAACAAYVWRQSPRPPASGEFVVIMAAVATHAMAYACCLLSTTLPWANAWFNVAMLGVTAIPPTITAFAFTYAGRGLSNRVLALLAVIPVVTFVAAWTNDWHALVWTETRMEHIEGMVLRKATQGPMWWVFLTFGYACIVASAAVFLATWLQGSFIHRRQSLLLFLGVVVPLTANVVYFATRPHIDVTPFAYTATAVTWTWALTRLDLLDLAPVAHDVVLGSIDELVLVLNARGRIVSANRAAQAFFHRSERELLGIPVGALLGGALVGVRADEAQEIEAEGRYFTVRRTALSETANEGAVIVMRDTTLRRETEDAREAALVAARETMRMRSELLARTSHEIRTPLHGILGSAELLNETQLDASQRRWVEAMVGCGASLLEIVNSVLDLEQARAGRMRPRLAPLQARALATAVMALFEGAAARRGLELRVVVQNAIPEWVQGDEVRLRQMLSNLVGNAVKFADRGVIEVCLAYEAGWLEVAVVDEGPGIDPQTMAKLFVPFEPGDARVGAGNGLGLALTSEIASALGGTITVGAHQGGTRATLRLPFAESTAPERASVTASRRRGRVLVVDDHPLNTAIVQARLESLGCSVVATQSASEGIALATHEAFDLVFMDVHMPEFSGADATRAIRGTKNERVLPIVGLSADTQASTRQECLNAGMQGLLGKPFEAGELERVLGLYLSAREDVDAPAVLARSRARDAYRTSVQADLSEMSAAVAQPDASEAARLAHRLRGAAALLEFTDVARACAVIERSDGAELALAFQALRVAVDASLEEAS